MKAEIIEEQLAANIFMLALASVSAFRVKMVVIVEHGKQSHQSNCDKNTYQNHKPDLKFRN